MKEGKIWGTTENVCSNSLFEFHRIEFKRDSECSKHKHQYKWNGFFVERGKLLIRVWKNSYDLIDQTVLKAGDFTKVKPGEYHQFRGLEEGIAFELYWAEFSHEDIERETIGKGPRSYSENEEEVSSIIHPNGWNLSDKNIG